jgi:DNA primase
MRSDSLTFPEAVSQLAGRCGIPLPETRQASGEKAEARDRLYAIQRRAQEFYADALRGHEGEKARAYLDSRGLSRETIEGFGVGFAPPGWENLLRELGRDYAPSEVEEAGLALPRKSGEGHYDRFRGRITFAVRDITGRVLGFGARVIPGEAADDEPKYLNSPETPIYRKGEILYGLDRAKEGIRKAGHAVVVEGYLDVITMHQHGLPVAVAPCGTALTESQARLLARFAPMVLVNFDADEAGEKAATRSLAPFLEAGLELRIVRLPAGEDPDSFLRKEGSEAYRARIAEARELLDFLLEGAEARGETKEARGKKGFLLEAVPLLARVPDRLVRSEYAARLAERLRIDDALVLEEVRRALRDGRGQLDLEEGGAAKGTELSLCERGLLRAILEDEGQREKLLPWLRIEGFTGLPGEPVFRALLELRDEGAAASWQGILDRLAAAPAAAAEGAAGAGEDWGALVARLGAEASVEGETPDGAGCLEAVRRMQAERGLRRVQHEIQEAERAGETERLEALLRRKVELRRALER